MPIPRPKILTCITVPAGGWTFRFEYTLVVALDTTKNVTVPAGDYFIAWDNQADDLIYALSNAIQTGMGGDAATRKILIYIDANNKINFAFDGAGFTGATKEVRVPWAFASAGLANALGFDPARDWNSGAAENATMTADWEHSHGWYANEDGLLESLSVEDTSVIVSPQNVAISGAVSTQNVSQKYKNRLSLKYIQRDRMWSGGIRYGSTPVAPYYKNRGLECWWYAALSGIRFRVYRDHYINTMRSVEQGLATASNTTTLTDGLKNWSTVPQTYKARLLYIPNYSDVDGLAPMRYFITSHTATVATVPLAHPSGYNVRGVSTPYQYYIYEHTYGTYVIDFGEMRGFEPSELEGMDRYDLDIPLLRYI